MAGIILLFPATDDISSSLFTQFPTEWAAGTAIETEIIPHLTPASLQLSTCYKFVFHPNVVYYPKVIFHPGLSAIQSRGDWDALRTTDQNQHNFFQDK